MTLKTYYTYYKTKIINDNDWHNYLDNRCKFKKAGYYERKIAFTFGFSLENKSATIAKNIENYKFLKFLRKNTQRV